MDFKLGLVVFVVVASCHQTSSTISNSGWNSAPDTQYHIQTDEGSERYFRYQTTSGQYRKEKRLEDGTVIGTSGWVDPNGMLRLNDYIADDKGYRILRTKMVYVGNSEDIGKGVANAKHVPAQAGTLVVGDSEAPTSLKAATTTARPVDVTPIPESEAVYSPSIDTSYKYPAPENSVNAIGVVYSNQDADLPSKLYAPYANQYGGTQNRPAYPFDRANEERQSYQPPRRDYQSFGQRTNYVNNYDHPSYKQQDYNAIPRLPEGYGNKLPTYDGISTTRDGFRYYLPRQYHEEVSSPSGDTRTGSFGYIDPFGIRRVTYYNTNPGSGFIHRKNNRYVGFNATPYDPRF